jgi:FtsP/CotA-like multicopper oxidase with cupredoxin domain
MKRFAGRAKPLSAALSLSFVLLVASKAQAEIMGIVGPVFNLTASPAYISTPDGDSLFAWGYGVEGGQMQYPGPTLIVQEGDIVTINLTNSLPMPVSMVFPGQSGVTASGGQPGLLTQEAIEGGGISYSFIAREPGTYLYHSGTRPELQVEMGLVGALVVMPNAAKHAYNHAATAFDHEYLLLLTALAPPVHALVEQGMHNAPIDVSAYRPVLWAINGRSAPDIMAPAFAPWLPYQPYDGMLMMHPGERVLLRFLGAGTDPHPFHTHGNNMLVIARDGRMLESEPGAGPDLAFSDYTLTVQPGATYDAIFHWTGEKLGWDIYGHSNDSDPMEPNEYALDHGKQFPVVLPELQDLTLGAFYSGSPFLGAFGSLPPGEGGLNLNGGMFYMFHSHADKELVNNDIFPGGMMTMMLIEPPWIPIP